MKLTEEQKQDYLKDPYHCPYCGSEDIDAEYLGYTDESISLSTVTCNSCNLTWTDVWKLINILEDEKHD